jgi:hypothetical protein
MTNRQLILGESGDGKFVCSFPGMGGVMLRTGRLIEGITVPGGEDVPSRIPVLVGSLTSLQAALWSGPLAMTMSASLSPGRSLPRRNGALAMTVGQENGL